MQTFSAITHVIFDLDGLLLNTEPLIFEVAQAIAQRYGKTLDLSTRAQTAGRQARDSAQVVIDAAGLPIDVDTYLAEKEPLVAQYYPLAQPMPGARRLTRHLRQHNVPQAIATSSSQRPFSFKTQAYGDWLAEFSRVVTGDDPAIQRGKPAPDIFLIAARRLGADSSHCLVFEDSLAGVAAAKAAGMHVVAVPDPMIDPMLYADADQVLPSLESFEPVDWRLPGFTD
ncbi:MAG: HAD-IA family hydrolase [Elainellaceae cyanobacterium]